VKAEEKLKAIIEAQVKGGCGRYDTRWNEVIDEDGTIWKYGDDAEQNLEGHILEILLDTEGCKACYGEENVTYKTGRGVTKILLDAIIENKRPKKWEGASYLILDAWNEGEGNNWEEAIETAYDLLDA